MALQTCPKCGRQFYGVGCPTCDFPAAPPDRGERIRRLFLGSLALGIAAFGSWQFFYGKMGTANWPAAVVAAMFFLAGVQVIGNFQGRGGALVAAGVCAGFAALAMLAVSDAGGIRGGLPFFPSSWNRKLGQIVFGLGALMAAAMSVAFIYQALKPRPKPR